MKLEELKQLAEQGSLFVYCTHTRTDTRNKYYWNEDYTQCHCEKVKVRKFNCGARTADMPENQFYKINKKDYDLLVKLGGNDKTNSPQA